MFGIEKKDVIRSVGFRTYLRQCKRCDEIYKADSKMSRICPDCNLQGKRHLWKRKK